MTGPAPRPPAHPTPEASDGDPPPVRRRLRRPDRAAVAPEERRARLTGAVATALVALLGTVWALATPLFSAPDEPAHAVRAAATWTGDPSGTIYTIDGGPAGDVKVKRYEVPSPYDLGQPIAECNAFQALKPAGCGPPFDPTGEEERASSTAGFYPPLFYVAVGWPAAVTDGARSMYLMRLSHVALCAVPMGLGAWALARRRSSPALLGILLATTPMVGFLSGTVNSSGVEIAAAIGLFATLVALVEPTARPDQRRWGEAAAVLACGLLLCFTRTFSPGYAAVICGIVLVSSPGVWVRSVLRRRDVVVALGVLAVGAAVATLLIVRSGQFDTPATSGAPLPPGETPLSIGLGFQELGFRQMIGVFGWLDTGTAQLAYYLWLIACGALVVGAIVLGTWRRLLGVALALAATVVLPIAANWGQVETAGFVWQGRYSLPFAVGVPILAAVAWDEARGLGAAERRRAVVGIGVLAVVAHLYALYWALRRVAVGQAGELVFFGDAEWTPPFIGSLGALVVVALAGGAMVWLLARGPMVTGARAGAGGPPAPSLAATTADSDPPAAATGADAATPATDARPTVRPQPAERGPSDGAAP